MGDYDDVGGEEGWEVVVYVYACGSGEVGGFSFLLRFELFILGYSRCRTFVTIIYCRSLPLPGHTPKLCSKAHAGDLGFD